MEKQVPPGEMVAHYRRQRRLADLDGSLPVPQVTAALIEAVKARMGSK